ncbi:MAG TPA: hypothetical protein PKX94_02065 [Opitutales bacterium]|nr:hypothetical protein [Opitutales bacterium]HOO92226.1 hypothetical protein [Opitutales bacterium]
MRVLIQIPLLLLVFIGYGMLTLFSPGMIGIHYEMPLTPPVATAPATPLPQPDSTVDALDSESDPNPTQDSATPVPPPASATGVISDDKPVPLDAPASILFSVKLVSGKTWSLNVNEAFIIISLFILFVEIFKATRTSVVSIIDHLLSTFVFLAFLILFLTIKEAGTSTFFILTIISMIDVMCGFTVSISSARRDLAVGNERIL